MNRSTVTPDLLHHLINGSHAEAITRLAVAVVSEHGERVLLIEHAGDECDCSWEPPTDLVLPGETITDAVHRVATQAGIDIDHITSYLGHHDLRTDDDVLRVFGFAATTTDPDRICRLALTPHQWAAVDNLPDNIDRQALRFIDTAVRATGPMREDA